MSKAEAKARPIYVKRVKKVAGGHHGGAWKVAYADFVTAMMAFFMVMWLITAVSKDQRAAIFDYFKNPSMEPGKSVKPAPGQMGPGGASSAVINMGGGLDAPKSSLKQTDTIGATVMTSPVAPCSVRISVSRCCLDAASMTPAKSLTGAVSSGMSCCATIAAGAHSDATAKNTERRTRQRRVQDGDDG